MILVDANLLLYAEDASNPRNAAARAWWDARLSSADPVLLSWETITAFLRIGTNPRVFQRPLTMAEAVARVESWLAQPCVRLARPTERHWEVLRGFLAEGQAVANLVMDAHLAALAHEHGAELCSCDADFSRFPALAWSNPLA
jgi:toxin-antitoxin system PIN domain toxin